MSETVLAAIIAGGVTLIVCLINNIFQNQKADEQMRQTAAMMEYKLDQLTKKVEAHNNLIDRMYGVERKAEIHEEKLKVANHRIGDLEKYTGCNRRKDDYPPHE